jgi:hypothetical protein
VVVAGDFDRSEFARQPKHRIIRVVVGSHG